MKMGGSGSDVIARVDANRPEAIPAVRGGVDI